MNGKVRTNEQRLRLLDQMDEREVANLLTELMTRMGPDEEYELRHEDYAVPRTVAAAATVSVARVGRRRAVAVAVAVAVVRPLWRATV